MSVLELEVQILSIVRQLLQAVSYLHSEMIAHRDIRLETVEIISPKAIQDGDIRITLKSLHKAVQLTDKG